MTTSVFGLEVEDIGENVTPLECVMILKGFDEDGDVCLYPRMTGLTHWEAIGMLQVEARRLLDEMMAGFTDEADE